MPQLPYPKSSNDQLREIRKLLADARDRVDQASWALDTLAMRLKGEADENPKRR